MLLTKFTQRTHERKVYSKDSRYIMNYALSYAHVIISHPKFSTGEDTTEVKERYITHDERAWRKASRHRWRNGVHELKFVADDTSNNRVVPVGGIFTLIAKHHVIDLDGQNVSFGVSITSQHSIPDQIETDHGNLQ